MARDGSATASIRARGRVCPRPGSRHPGSARGGGTGGRPPAGPAAAPRAPGPPDQPACAAGRSGGGRRWTRRTPRRCRHHHGAGRRTRPAGLPLVGAGHRAAELQRLLATCQLHDGQAPGRGPLLHPFRQPGRADNVLQQPADTLHVVRLQVGADLGRPVAGLVAIAAAETHLRTDRIQEVGQVGRLLGVEQELHPGPPGLQGAGQRERARPVGRPLPLEGATSCCIASRDRLQTMPGPLLVPASLEAARTCRTGSRCGGEPAPLVWLPSALGRSTIPWAHADCRRQPRDEEEQVKKIASELLVERLADWGVDTMFGLPGDGINGIMEGLRRHQDKVRFVLVHHEEAAAFMAAGYAKATGRVGVCLATSGPGGLHLLSGLYDAKLDHAPVLAITGMQETAVLGTGHQQEGHLDRVLMDVAEYNVMITVPASIPSLVDRAMRTSLARRTVSHLTFPNDLQVAPADAEPWPTVGPARTPATAPTFLGV